MNKDQSPEPEDTLVITTSSYGRILPQKSHLTPQQEELYAERRKDIWRKWLEDWTKRGCP